MLDSDQPIKISKDDDFGRDRFAQRIAEVIIKRNDESSIAVGIHAPWGEGKTSVLNMIIEELDKENILYLSFNPWRFPDEELLLKNFYFELGKKLDISLETTWEKVSSFFRRKSKGLNAIRSGISDAIEIATISEATIEILKERIEQKLKEAEKRIVIIMDDIDRLDNDEIQAVFRLVKLSANLPYTAYILSFDEQRVAQAISERYGKDAEAGQNFLEKIIQVSLPLPPPPPQKIMDLTRNGINSALKLAEIELTEEQINRLSESFDKTFREQLTTPRISKRLSNALSFSLPLMKGEVDNVDLIYIEAIKVFYPKLYTVIRKSGDIICIPENNRYIRKFKQDMSSYLKKQLDDSLIGIHEAQQNQIGKLLHSLFPQIEESLNLNLSYDISDELIKAKRICTQEYFSRYFTYGVQSHDISNNEIKEFLILVPLKELNFAREYLDKILENDRARINIFVSKLRQSEDEVSEVTAQELASLIALNSHKLPQNHPEDRLFGMGTYSQVARLIVHLLKRIENMDKRDKFAIQLAEEISSITFAHDFARMLDAFNSSNKTNKSNRTVSEECEEKINQIISTQIANEANKSPLEENYYLDARELYELWGKYNPESLGSYLRKRAVENPQHIIDFLDVLLRANLKKDENLNFYTHKNTNWYLFVSELIEPQFIIEKLQLIYPDLDGKWQSSVNDSKSIANWFFKMHDEANQNSS